MRKITDINPDEDIIDFENIAALEDAIKAADTEYEFLMKIPSGKKIALRFKKQGMGKRLEADHGHESSKSPAFDNKRWCADQVRRLNAVLLGGVKFVDDLHHRPANFAKKELPFSWLTEEDFQILMEKIFPGFSIPASTIKDKADAIPDAISLGVSSHRNPDSGT